MPVAGAQFRVAFRVVGAERLLDPGRSRAPRTCECRLIAVAYIPLDSGPDVDHDGRVRAEFAAQRGDEGHVTVRSTPRAAISPLAESDFDADRRSVAHPAGHGPGHPLEVARPWRDSRSGPASGRGPGRRAGRGGFAGRLAGEVPQGDVQGRDREGGYAAVAVPPGWSLNAGVNGGVFSRFSADDERRRARPRGRRLRRVASGHMVTASPQPTARQSSAIRTNSRWRIASGRWARVGDGDRLDRCDLHAGSGSRTVPQVALR